MRINSWKVIFWLIPGVLTLSACKELKKEMFVSTGDASNIKTNSAEVAGIIVDLGEGITQYGHYYSKTADPTSDIMHTSLDKPEGEGSFLSQITGLEAGTKYYFTAYSSNGNDIVFGDIKNFTTLPASVPVLNTQDITSITTNSAASGGNITSDGGAAVTSRGVCWSMVTGPAVADSKSTDGTGSGTFTSSLSGLVPGTKYYIRAYAINIAGVGYGNELSFTTTPGNVPVLSTTTVTAVTKTTASSGGNITSDGGAMVNTRGVCWSTSSNPTISDNKTSDGNGTGIFTSNLTGLTPGTTYHIRAYASSIIGTGYGEDLNFTTNPPDQLPPTVAISAATGVNNATATINGAVNANNLNTDVTFEYGKTTLYGTTVPALQSPVTGNTITNVSATISGLTPGTLYHYKVRAVSTSGTVESEDMTFTTTQVPVAITEAASPVTSVTAILNGKVNPSNLTTDVFFEYGQNISYGTTALGAPNPVNGSDFVNINSSLTGLTPNTTYHYRVKAVSSGGTVYGNDMTFNTLCSQPSATTNQPALGASSVSLTGTVNANGFLTDVSFEYGASTTYGSTLIAIPSTASGNSNVAVSASLTGLTPGQTYHYRVKASNCGGTVYGDDQTFITLSEALVFDALTTCYSKLYDYIEFTYLFDAVYSNDSPAPNSAWTAIYTHSQSSGNEKVDMLWSKAYDIIFKTNYVIINSSIISDNEIRQGVVAQAKAIRAYIYNNLLIWYGGVILEQGPATSNNLPRSTETETVNFIRQDATDALAALPVAWPTTDRFRVNKYFASGVMIRSLLFTYNFATAAPYADDIVSSGLYALSADPINFTSANSEIIWGFDKSSGTEFTTFFTKGIYVPAFRFTETCLVMAHCRTELGDLAGALSYYNMLLVRRGLATLPSLGTQNNARDLIYNQWRTELFYEGNIFITMKRFGKATTALGIPDFKLLLPVPSSVLNANPNVVQNTGY